MAKPKPTATQLGLIVGGAVGAAAITLTLGIGGAVGGALIGAGAAVGGIPYFRAVDKHKKQNP
jgi:hypothetical protein